MPFLDCNLPPVVITRPIAQARILEKKIAAIGRKTIVLPLLEISPLDDNTALDTALQNLSQYDLVAFVSPNAIDAAFTRCRFHSQAWSAQVPLAVVGEGSRQALAYHGITAATTPIYRPVDPERTDSETLLATIDLTTLAGKKVLIVRGDSGRELMADTLQAAGAIVTKVAAYRRAAPAIDEQGLQVLRQLLLKNCEWIITSSEALRVLMQWTMRLAGLPYLHAHAHQSEKKILDIDFVVNLQVQKLIIPHVRIAETALSMGFTNILRTPSGDAGLLAALHHVT